MVYTRIEKSRTSPIHGFVLSYSGNSCLVSLQCSRWLRIVLYNAVRHFGPLSLPDPTCMATHAPETPDGCRHREHRESSAQTQRGRPDPPVTATTGLGYGNL